MQNLEVQEHLYQIIRLQIPDLPARFISYKLELEGVTKIQSVNLNQDIKGMNPMTIVFTIETDKGKSNWESLDPLPYANRLE